MSEKVFRELATQKDLAAFPMNKRYAVFCKPSLEGDPNFDCFSRDRKGLLGEFDDNTTAEETALGHEHAVIIRYKAQHQAKFYDH